MDQIDKRLLEIIQDDFPVVPEPYQELAHLLGISENDVMKRIEDLQKKSIIRRLGAIFDSRKLGYKSTLCAMKVPADELERTAEIVNSYPGVTHNYLREHEYNMWFTLIAPSIERISAICQEISDRAGNENLIQLPAKRFFKIKVKFSITEVDHDRA